MIERYPTFRKGLESRPITIYEPVDARDEVGIDPLDCDLPETDEDALALLVELDRYSRPLLEL